MKLAKFFGLDKSKKSGLRSYCKACGVKNASTWQKDNPERHAKFVSAWEKANPEKRKEITRIWAIENPDRRRASFGKRRALKLEARHPDCDDAEIRKLHALAKELEGLTGEPYAVDHIFPLAKGGPDHHDNLQVLPASWNCSKGASLTWRREPAIHWTELPPHVLAMISPENLAAAYAAL